MGTLVAKNLRWLIRTREINPSILATATKVHQPTIHRILSGESQDPKTATLQPIANYFGVSVADMREKDLAEQPAKALASSLDWNPQHRVPVLRWSSLAHLDTAMNTARSSTFTDWEIVTIAPGNNTFAIQVADDALMPEFPKGTVLVIEPGAESRLWDYVIVQNGGATLKQLVTDGVDNFLRSANPMFPLKPCTPELKIVGIVLEAIRRFR